MVRGLYTGYTGMANEQKRMDIITNNLANSATIGYKEESVTNQSFDEVFAVKIRDGSELYNNRIVGGMDLGVKLGEAYTNYKQGSLRETGNTYDLAIDGKGFFAVRVLDNNGNESIKYTRDGSFKVSRDGYILDEDRNYLQGESGNVQVPTDAADIVIDESGMIYADGVYIDRVTIADFEDYDYLEKFGENMYQTVDGAAQIDSSAMIRQGYTEQSNVNVVSEMVEMITITRAYEANQKVIKTVDTMLDLSVNSVGKL